MKEIKLEGKIVEISRREGKKDFVFLTIEGDSRREVPFPFPGKHSLEVIPLQQTLMGSKVIYSYSHKEESAAGLITADTKEYTLEVRNGPFKGQKYIDNFFSRG